jgi:hypothetical protein
MTTFEGGNGPDPGLDLHAWESTWASIDESARDDPNAALSQYADLVERMLVANGSPLDDAVAAQGNAPELIVTYRSARETAERAEVGAASRSEVELAIDDLREVFSSITGDRAGGEAS